MGNNKSEDFELASGLQNPTMFLGLVATTLNFKDSNVGVWIEYPDQRENFWTESSYSILSMERIPDQKPSIFNIQPYVHHSCRHLISDMLVRMRNNTLDSFLSLSLRFKHKELGYIQILLTVEPVTEDSRLLYWYGTIQNISPYKELEDQNQFLISRITDFFESFPLLILVLDNHGAITYWGRRNEAFTGFKKTEVESNREAFRELFPDSEQRKRFRVFAQNRENPVVQEIEITTKKGSKKVVEWHQFQLPIDKQNVLTFIIGKDKTLQQKHNKSLLMQVEGLKLLSNVAVDLVGLPFDENCYHHLGLVLEKQFSNCYFAISSSDVGNEFLTVEGIYGFSTSEWERALEIIGWNPVGRRFQQSPEVVREKNLSGFNKIDKTLYDFTEGEITSAASRNFERIFSIDIIYSLALFHHETFFGWVFIFCGNDIDINELSGIKEIVSLYSLALERKREYDERLLAQQRAEEANRLKSAYLANIGHEIRTPLNAILGFTQLLSLPNLPKEKKRQYIDIITSKGKMLGKLISDIVDIGKVEKGELTLVKSDFEPNALLKSIEAFYSSERVFQHREAVEIRLVLPDNTDGFKLYSDQGRLEQVFTNLLDNALKFTEKGFIEFGYQLSKDKILFYVLDSGIGIDSRMHKIIFDSYQQIEENIARTSEGKGLGLAISKGIVKLLGGDIWVESELQKGAKFIFTIPLEKEPEAKICESYQIMDMDIQAKDWKNKVLLIAEDEEINFLFISELLEPTGVNMLWARDGAQAVELVETIKNIDAILMDIRMPKKDGYAASLEIRQINPNIPIIAQTAYAFSGDKAKAEAAGCNNYITKPINSKELFEILDGYLG
jgi:PAS domain S-box-containing protein